MSRIKTEMDGTGGGRWERRATAEHLSDRPHRQQESYEVEERPEEALACPECGYPTDNGHDRGYPPNAYLCSQCEDY